jgi:hypothetical protein
MVRVLEDVPRDVNIFGLWRTDVQPLYTVPV